VGKGTEAEEETDGGEEAKDGKRDRGWGREKNLVQYTKK
jgi:hypothetical protein